ncbi:undecaprenyl-diphosphate phosphatase [Dietzia sp. DQ12-76]|uniref:Undecaprenyl-diphosphatase n=2 Tax=Dietziaceae TaxID=85029 RepID=A0A2A2WUW5_9ACTN|nr:undecaprenyl-diphosphate phosphatase [Dietzia sp. JS16-p6b]MBB1022865.1 undecaprenyl-diphosphate phosphatase [Dietzia sp. DQ12-76]MBB1027668.1 undecaprenyl-diphosphate phosphatase [Dietzia sp. DQ11-38-2]PAY24853.1 undecaprenyl-diphosphatase [Dietzia natronolimnaea]QGW24687.1 undecaprenyl pyrophosphate phosphatase [Dietzia sp. DQ12-45-1b]
MNPTVLAAPAADGMSWLQVVVLSVIQGITEFLPVSSSGHLRIFSTWMFGSDAGASFTAVVQLGTEAAVLVFFFKDIVRIVVAWFRGVFDAGHRDDPDYRLGWYVIIGSIPIAVIGFLGKDLIRDAARNLWITAIVLIAFSFVFLIAEKVGRQDRPVDGQSLEGLRFKDAVVMGLAQCLALIPGVSRSGGTISAGLFLNMSREAAARFSFLLAIPAVLASGLFSLPDAFEPSVGQSATGIQLVVGSVIAFVLGYIAIAWLLRFVQKHSLAWFAGYRIILGLVVIVLLSTGTIPAT